MTGSTLGNLAGTAVHGATQVARHAFRTAAWAAGVVRGAAEAGVAAAREASNDQAGRGTPADKSAETSAETSAGTTTGLQAPTTGRAAPGDGARDQAAVPTQREQSEDPRDRIPGPDVVAPAVPRAEDLPEPVVIEADDAGGASGEDFQHEPKAAGRDSEHEGRPGDREEAEGYLEEVVATDAPDVDVETPVGTTGADVATNPATAESDLQQPGTPPLGDPATVAAAISEARTLREAGERDPGS